MRPSSSRKGVEITAMGRKYFRFFNFDSRGGGDWVLEIPNHQLFAPLLEKAFPFLSGLVWKPTLHYANGLAVVQGINDDEASQLREYLEILGSAGYAYAEIGENVLCVSSAYQYNDEDPSERTETGELYRLGKFYGNEDRANELGLRLINMIKSLRFYINKHGVLCVPRDPAKTGGYYLPAFLAKILSDYFSMEDFSEFIKKIKPTRDAKDAPIEEKREMLKGAFKCGCSFNKKNLILLDDLCMSGNTIFEVYGTLKEARAGEISIITAVKSLKDSANV